jgi:hypothetical protein
MIPNGYKVCTPNDHKIYHYFPFQGLLKYAPISIFGIQIYNSGAQKLDFLFSPGTTKNPKASFYNMSSPPGVKFGPQGRNCLLGSPPRVNILVSLEEQRVEQRVFTPT